MVDFFPLLVFFGFYVKAGIYPALQALMVAMPIAFLIKWKLTGEIDKMLLGSTVLLLVFGAITLAFKNPLFLYWKPTVFYWLVGVLFIGSQFIGKQPLVKRMLTAVGLVDDMPDKVWSTLNIVWAVFWIAMGALNLFVAYGFSEAFWVKFKVFGFTGIMFAFLIGQMIWLFKAGYIKEVDEAEAE